MINLRTAAVAAAWSLLLLVLPVNAPAAGMDGVIMQDGRMMMMKAGKPMTPMTSDLTMSDGTIMTTDGVAKRKDGTRTHLTNGQMMMMDGKIMEGGKAAAMEESDD